MTRLFRSILTITLLTLIATISFAQDSSGIRNVIRFQSHYIIRALVISGNYAYCALGNNGICVVDVTNPNTPREIGYCTTPGCAVGIAISGNYAFVADSSFGIRVIDISDISNLYEISSLPTNAKGIRVSGGYAYVITYLNQFEMIDISSPYSLQIVSTLNVNGEISGFEINRGFAYIAALSAGLRIIDIRDSTNIFETGSYVPVPTYAKCVTVRGDTVYLGDYDGSYLREIDVSTPSSPRQTRSFQLTGDEFNSINQVSVLGDYAYLGCSSGGSYGYGHTTWWHYSLFTLTVRISNPDSIFEVGGHEYGYFSGSDYSGEGGSSYSSGSSYGIVTDIKAFGNQVYTAYGDHCIIIENTFNTTPVHGTALYWSFQYTTVTGNIVYVADNNTLRLFNISNPSHPSNLSTYSTRGNIKKVDRSWIIGRGHRREAYGRAGGFIDKSDRVAVSQSVVADVIDAYLENGHGIGPDRKLIPNVVVVNLGAKGPGGRPEDRRNQPKRRGRQAQQAQHRRDRTGKLRNHSSTSING